MYMCVCMLSIIQKDKQDNNRVITINTVAHAYIVVEFMHIISVITINESLMNINERL